MRKVPYKNNTVEQIILMYLYIYCSIIRSVHLFQHQLPHYFPGLLSPIYVYFQLFIKIIFTICFFGQCKRFSFLQKLPILCILFFSTLICIPSVPRLHFLELQPFKEHAAKRRHSKTPINTKKTKHKKPTFKENPTLLKHKIQTYTAIQFARNPKIKDDNTQEWPFLTTQNNLHNELLQ